MNDLRTCVGREMTFDEFTRALVGARVVDPDAVEKPDEYDDGVTLSRMLGAYNRLTAPLTSPATLIDPRGSLGEPIV